jgi:hypothetical protein
MVGATIRVVAEGVDFGYSGGIAFRRTCSVSLIGIGRFSLERHSGMPGLDMLRVRACKDALSPVVNCDVWREATR